jgi:hypothetical protein
VETEQDGGFVVGADLAVDGEVESGRAGLGHQGIPPDEVEGRALVDESHCDGSAESGFKNSSTQDD